MLEFCVILALSGGAAFARASSWRRRRRSLAVHEAHPAGEERSPAALHNDSEACTLLSKVLSVDGILDTVVNDVKAMLAKGEADLMRMSRKCLIHSRVLSVTDDGVPVKLGAPSAGSSRSLLGLQTSAQVDAALNELEEELTQPRESESDIPSRRVRRP